MAIETKKILIRRGSDIANATTVDQGELLLDTSDNKVYVGTGSNATKQIANLADMGVTAEAADINKLDDLATTATQLGYLSDVTSNIQSQLNGKASLSGAAFTGAVTVQAPSADSNPATRLYVDNAISDLIDGAPEALNTLNELADSLAPKLDAPLTGTPTAPTAAVGTNTTQIATTAYVQGEISNVNGLSGVTADTDELNILDGATITTTQLNSIPDLAPKASPIFTGTPKLTVVDGETSTDVNIATTAFVQSEIAANNATNNEFEFVGKSSASGTTNTFTNTFHTFDFDDYDYKFVFEFETNAESNGTGYIRFNGDTGNNYYWLTRSTTSDGDTQTTTSAEATSIIDFGEGLDADSTNVAKTVLAGELTIRKPYTSAPQVGNNYQWTYLVTGKALTTAVRYSAGSQYLVESNFYAHWYPTSTTSTHDITQIILFSGLDAGTVDKSSVRVYRRAK